jgi:integrase
MTLSAKQVELLKKPGRYFDGHGLYLQVQSATSRSWLLRYERNGRERWLGLGPLHTVSLKKARERAREARLQLLDGIDPIEARKAKRDQAALEAARAITFEAAAQAYFDAHEKGWKNAKQISQFLTTLKTYVYPTMGRLPVKEIDTGLVLRVMEQPVEGDGRYPAGRLWDARTETANRLRGRIEKILDWAAVRGFRTGENPARWRGHLSEVLPAPEKVQKTQHHPALPYAEMSDFMTALTQRDGVAARALEFTILCAARTGETIGAVWDEIDLIEQIWTVPANRIKGGREHRVPLSDRAVEILRLLPREHGNPFVFIGPRRGGLSNMAMASVLGRMGRDNATVHGFRSTFRDWAADRTNYQNHIVEMALAHVVGNAVEAAYRRGDLLDKRRQLMADWARYCSTKHREGGEVIALRA